MQCLSITNAKISSCLLCCSRLQTPCRCKHVSCQVRTWPTFPDEHILMPQPIHLFRARCSLITCSSRFLNVPSAPGIGVNCTGGSGVAAVAGAGAAGVRTGAFGPSSLDTSGVGRPTGITIVDSCPLTVTTMDVFDRVGREQYPISTQLSPPKPEYDAVKAPTADVVVAMVVKLLPSGSFTQSRSTGAAQFLLFRYQQNFAALLRQAHS